MARYRQTLEGDGGRGKMRARATSTLRWAKSFIQSQKNYLVPPKAQIEGNAVHSIFVQAGIREEIMLKAIYRCSECLSERVYGNCKPDNELCSVIVWCSQCKKNTPHTYLRTQIIMEGITNDTNATGTIAPSGPTPKPLTEGDGVRTQKQSGETHDNPNANDNRRVRRTRESRTSRAR